MATVPTPAEWEMMSMLQNKQYDQPQYDLQAYSVGIEKWQEFQAQTLGLKIPEKPIKIVLQLPKVEPTEQVQQPEAPPKMEPVIGEYDYLPKQFALLLEKMDELLVYQAAQLLLMKGGGAAVTGSAYGGGGYAQGGPYDPSLLDVVPRQSGIPLRHSYLEYSNNLIDLTLGVGGGGSAGSVAGAAGGGSGGGLIAIIGAAADMFVGKMKTISAMNVNQLDMIEQQGAIYQKSVFYSPWTQPIEYGAGDWVGTPQSVQMQYARQKNRQMQRALRENPEMNIFEYFRQDNLKNFESRHSNKMGYQSLADPRAMLVRGYQDDIQDLTQEYMQLQKAGFNLYKNVKTGGKQQQVAISPEEFQKMLWEQVVKTGNIDEWLKFSSKAGDVTAMYMEKGESMPERKIRRLQRMAEKMNSDLGFSLGEYGQGENARIFSRRGGENITSYVKQGEIKTGPVTDFDYMRDMGFVPSSVTPGAVAPQASIDSSGLFGLIFQRLGLPSGASGATGMVPGGGAGAYPVGPQVYSPALATQDLGADVFSSEQFANVLSLAEEYFKVELGQETSVRGADKVRSKDKEEAEKIQYNLLPGAIHIEIKGVDLSLEKAKLQIIKIVEDHFNSHSRKGK